MINVTLKDGSKKQVNEGISAFELAKSINEGLARNMTAVLIDREVKDLRYKIEKDCNVEILTFDNCIEGKKAYWHTTSHIMAQAVKRLFQNVKLAIGPAIDEGFYYDFETETPFSEEDKQKIEEEMRKIIKEDLAIERFSLSKKEAIELMKDEPYKIELINELKERRRNIFL